MQDEPKNEDGNGTHVRKPVTKEQELTQAVKMTFPASDPISLESDAVRAKKPKLVGVEEVLKQKAAAEDSNSG